MPHHNYHSVVLFPRVGKATFRSNWTKTFNLRHTRFSLVFNSLCQFTDSVRSFKRDWHWTLSKSWRITSSFTAVSSASRFRSTDSISIPADKGERMHGIFSDSQLVGTWIIACVYMCVCVCFFLLSLEFGVRLSTIVSVNVTDNSRITQSDGWSVRYLFR